MNDKLKNLTEQPDPEVWQRIQKTMHHTALLRRVAMGAAGVAVVGAVVATVWMWPKADESTTQVQTSPVVAQVDVQEVTAVQPVNKTTAVQATEETAPVADVQSVATTSVMVVECATAQPTVEKGITETPIVATTPKVTVSSTVTPKQEPTPEVVAQSSVAESEPTVAEPVVGTASDIVKLGGGTAVEDTILWIPNVFMPGADNADYNTFRVRLNKTTGSVSNFKMTVFNRSGYQVFHSNDINYGWDGTYRGRSLPQATYVYMIYYTDKDKVQHQRKGTVTLVR